jgi:hypothetical protein
MGFFKRKSRIIIKIKNIGKLLIEKNQTTFHFAKSSEKLKFN